MPKLSPKQSKPSYGAVARAIRDRDKPPAPDPNSRQKWFVLLGGILGLVYVAMTMIAMHPA